MGKEREQERERERKIETERGGERVREIEKRRRKKKRRIESRRDRERDREIERDRERERAESERERKSEIHAEGERLIQRDRATESGTHSLHQRIPANHCQKISPANPCQQRTSEFLPAAEPQEFLPAEQTHAKSVALQDLHQRLRSPHTRIPARVFFGAARSSGGREPAGSWAPKCSRESRTRPDLSSHACCTQPTSPSQSQPVSRLDPRA